LIEIWRRWDWGKRAAALVALALAVSLPPALWWGPSAVLRYALTRGLEAQGLRVAALDQAVLSLTQGRIDLRKLDVQPPFGAPITVARIDLEFSWRALLAGRVEIAELRLAGVELRLERGRDGAWRLPLPEGPQAAPESSAPFALGIARLIATDGRVTLADGARTLIVGVDRLDLSGFDLARPGQALRVDVNASLAGGRVRASGEGTLLADAPELAATINAAGVELGPLAPFLGVALAGALDGEVSLRATPAAAELRGQMALARFRAPGVAAAALEWRGRADWAADRALDVDGVAQARGLVAAELRANAMRFEGAAKIDAGIALQGEASFDEIAYQAPELRIAATRLAARALRATWTSSGWTLATDAAADGVAIAAQANEISIDTLKAPGLRARMAGERGRVETPLEIGIATLASADLRARIEGLRSPGLALDLGPDAALAGRVSSARAEIAAAGTHARLDALDLDLRRLAWAPALAAEFHATATGAAVDAPELAARAATLVAEGRVADSQFAGRVAADGPSLELGAAQVVLRAARLGVDGRAADAGFAGQVSLDAPVAELKAARIDARAARLAGNLAYDKARATLDGSARANALRVRRADGLDLAEIGALALDGIVASAQTSRAGNVLAERVRILRRETARDGVPAFPWRLEAPRLEIGGVALAADGALRAGPVRARGAILRVTRTKTGVASLDAIAAGRDPAAPSGPGPGFRLESVALDDARLEFEDRVPATPVRVDADRVALRLGALDTTAPATPTRASLRARLGGAGSLELQGEATPLAPKIGFDLTGTARGIDLPPFSPYVGTALGVELRTGRFDLDLRLTAREEALSGRSQWRIQNLELDERGANALAREAGAPVAMALGFLRDGAGDIALDIPISGKLDDPSFDTADAVRQAVGGAIRGALSSTFNALFPLGFILGELLGGEAHAALPPLAFAPGLAGLDARATQTLDALAGVLASRPSARLDICGFAGPEDLRALSAARGTDPRGQELAETLRRLFARATGAPPSEAGEDQLRALAEERARAVKDRLAGRAGVDAARLFECRPVVETEADATPRVELRF
jgi:hypothetical protein